MGELVMQADQVIWLVAGVITVLALLFVVRLFRMPRDERLAFPSTDAEQGPAQAADVPRISSRKEAIAFLQRETGDQGLALLLIEAA